MPNAPNMTNNAVEGGLTPYMPTLAVVPADTSNGDADGRHPRLSRPPWLADLGERRPAISFRGTLSVTLEDAEVEGLRP